MQSTAILTILGLSILTGIAIGRLGLKGLMLLPAVGLMYLVFKQPAIYLGFQISGAVPVFLMALGLRDTKGWSVFAVIAIIILLISVKEKVKYIFRPIVVTQYLLLIVLIFGLLWSNAQAYGLEKVLKFFNWCLVPMVGILAVWLTGKKKHFLIPFTACIILVGIYGAYLFYKVGSFTDYRLVAVYENAIWFGRMAGLGVLICLWYLLNRTGNLALRYSTGIVGAVCFFSMVASQTRGAVASFAVAVLVLILSMVKAHQRLRVIGLSIIVSLLFAWIVSFLPPEFTVRFQPDFASSSATTRMGLYKTAWQMFLYSPIIGYGTGGFSVSNILFAKYPHNIILELGSEIGAMGLTLFLAFVIYVMVKGIKYTFIKDSGGVSNIMLLAFSGFIFALVSAQFSGDIQANSSIWIFGGMVLGNDETESQ